VANEFSFPCPHCSKEIVAPVELAGVAAECPACKSQIRVPAAAPVPTAVPLAASVPAGESVTAASSELCAICQSPLGADETKAACPDCAAVYHADCWQENRGCAVYGCPQVPPTEKHDALEVPMAYWGQEHKNCPVCGTQMLAAATRCRSCGTTFDSAAPTDRDQFVQKLWQSSKSPALRKQVVWCFAACVLPCTAPIAIIVSFIFFAGKKEDIRALPAIYGALSKIGLIVGLAETLVIVAGLVLSAMK
jgi:predicted RNA-binding Zn-ribbon protein involved in translation (DUF1610 family)